MKFFIIIFIFIINLYSKQHTVSVGILVDKKNNNDFITLVSKVIEKNFNDQTNSKSLKIILYYNKELLFEDFKNNKLKNLILPPFIYLENKEKVDKYQKARWALKFNNQIKEEYYLLANKKAKNVLGQIYKYNLITLDGVRNTLIWVKYLYYKEKKTNILKSVKKHSFITKENKLIYNIFFNKNNIGVITKPAYETLIELNPQLKRSVKIIAKSDALFISYIGFDHVSLTLEEASIYKSAAKNLDNILGYSKLASSIDISLSEDLTNKEYETLNKFHKEYKLFEKLYSNKSLKKYN